MDRHSGALRLVAPGVVALAVAACGGTPGSPAASSPAAGSTTPTTGASSAPGSFTYWSMWKEGEPQQKVLQAAIDSFTKDTGITVEVQWQGRAVLTKLVPTLNTDEVPDLVDHSGNSVRAALVPDGQAKDLSDAYALDIPGEAGKKVSDVIPSKFVDLVRDDSGKPFMVPYEVASAAIWFNAADLPHVKASPPTTWDAFVKLLDEAKAAGRAAIAQDTDSDYNAYWTSEALIKVLGPGGLYRVATDKTGAAWDDPKVLDAVKKIEQLVKGDYFIKGYDSSTWPAQQQAWAKGEADFLFMGIWAPSETAPDAKTGFQYDSFQFPSLGGADSVEAGVIGWAIPAKARNAAPAEQFMAYFLNKDRLVGIATESLNLTPRVDVAVPSQLTSIKAAIDTRPFRAWLDGLTDLPDYVSKVFEPVTNDLLWGKISAEEFVANIKNATIDYWKLQG